MFFSLEKIEKQLPEIRAAMYRGKQEIPVWKFHEGDCPGAARRDFDDRGWPSFQVGGQWGGYDVTAWFRARVAIPEEWRNRKLALRLLPGPRDGGGSTAEALLYVDGAVVQGIDVWHEEAWLPREMLRDGGIQVALKAWSGTIDVPARRRFAAAQLVWLDEPAECFYYLARTLARSIAMLGENDLGRIRMLRALDAAFRAIDFGDPGSDRFYRSIQAAGAGLEASVQELESFDECKPHVLAVGHSHLDMAWLWRLKDTRDKAARTWSTALHLMRQYPEYHFIHSSPQLYEYIKQDYPEIFAQVKAHIAAGRWEISGATWIEPDTNLPGGESLVRQVLFGKRYMRDEFGVDTNILWMPDVFGYSYALPQIMARSGLRYLMTTKLSWNQFNRFPYDTFRWRGLDGSEVLAHFVTTPEEHSDRFAYVGALQPFEVKGLWDNYKQKDANDELLFLYGWGDGGGGPTKEMLESGRVLRNLPGLPSVELGKAEPYFERLEKRVEGRDLPVWDGELYLEYHRGTYTSQAAVKRANREAEMLYHQAEWLAALADVCLQENHYPAEALRRGWEKILLNQFHDILPGSSIRQVYEDAQQDYAFVSSIGEEALASAQGRLLAAVGTAQPALVVFNSTSQRRSDLVELDWSEQWQGQTIENRDGTASPCQLVERNGEKKILLHAQNIPPLGYATYPQVAREEETSVEAAHLIITPGYLQNDYYRIELNSHGQIASLYDRVNARQVLAPNSRANLLQAFEDKPMDFDAWDIDIYYRHKVRKVDELVEAVVEEQGPLRGVLRLTWKLNDSTITQRVTLYRHSPRIDFRSEIDWAETQTLLKAAFPVSIRATRATYEIQFGSIERPNHWNTSWDYARFETFAHKWADLSEGDYGVALLNDCKYGYDIKENVLRLTLLKSAIEPDATADRGHHEFTYSLLPHRGGWRDGGVVQEAYNLNSPLHAALIPAQPAAPLPPRLAFVQCDADNVMVETVKQAEDDCAWIVRVYEFKQAHREPVHLTFAREIKNAAECNLLEEDEQPVAYRGRTLEFAVAPFEIRTFKIWF